MYAPSVTPAFPHAVGTYKVKSSAVIPQITEAALSCGYRLIGIAGRDDGRMERFHYKDRGVVNETLLASD